MAEKEVRRQIVKAALLAIERVRAHRLSDLKKLRAAYEENGIHRITLETAESALSELRAHVFAITEFAAGFEGREYWTWNGHFVPTHESLYRKWMHQQIIETSERHQAEILTQLSSWNEPTFILSRLWQIAGAETFSEDSLHGLPEHGISSYEAKLILFYGLPLPVRRVLARQLYLRFDIRDVCPSNEMRRMGSTSAEYDHSVLTEGYFYGALRANAESLIHEPGDALSMGIDCSTFVQQAYERAGFEPNLFSSPISTAGMLRGELPGIQDGTFVVEPLHEESQLQPGDAVLWQGHVQVFLGRDESGRLRVAEAVGRRFKNLRESILQRQERDGNSVFKNPARPMFVFRFRKTPTGSLL